jgi:hypothetical protein
MGGESTMVHDTRCVVVENLGKEPGARLALRAVSVAWRDAVDDGMLHDDYCVSQLVEMLESTFIDLKSISPPRWHRWLFRYHHGTYGMSLPNYVCSRCRRPVAQLGECPACRPVATRGARRVREDWVREDSRRQFCYCITTISSLLVVWCVSWSVMC